MNIDPTPKRGSAPEKQEFPNFSRLMSLDNLDLSGDDSDGLRLEEEAIAGWIAADNAAMLELAHLSLNDPIEELQEFEYLLEGIEQDMRNEGAWSYSTLLYFFAFLARNGQTDKPNLSPTSHLSVFLQNSI